MHPQLFRIPGLNFAVYSYGPMLVIGFLLALELAKYLARRVKLDPEVFVNAGMIALIAGVVGARLSHVIENIHQYTDPNRTFWANLFDAVNIRSGGLTFYGGLILAFPLTIAYGIYKRVPIRLGMDIIAPCIMVGLGLGRVGCFLNGCCYGAPCDAKFVGAVTYPYYSNAYLDQVNDGVKVPPPELYVTTDGERRLVTPDELKQGYVHAVVRADDGQLKYEKIQLPDHAASIAASERSNPVHAAQLYSTVTALLIAAICVAYFTTTPLPGRVMALMLMLEGITRFILEILRAEPPIVQIAGHGWSLSMVLGVILAVAGVVMWFALGYGSKSGMGASPMQARAGEAPVPH